MSCEEMASLLPSYLDGELDIMRSVEVEKHLETCEECRKAVESQRALQTALRSPALAYSAPIRLERNILRAVRQEERKATSPAALIWRRYSFASTLAVLLLLAWGAWHFSAAPTNNNLVAQEILSSHVRSLMANHLTDVLSTDKHTVKPWFNGKLDFSPVVEDMADQGFPLIGGRMDYIDNRPVAALVYKRQKHVINLFLWPAASSAGSENGPFTRQGYNILHWTQSGTAYWLVSDLNTTDLRDFAARYRERVALHSRP